MTTLDSYITLGRSGLRVSPYCLGTMTFGEDHGWGASVADSETMLDAYLSRGGNFVDTANVYTGGHSEEILGDAFATRPGLRDRIVLASKFFANLEPGNPNGGGTGRKALLGAVHNSLRRLRTDYLDIYWIHNWDSRTPLEETLRTLDTLVTAGTIRYVGFSDLPAWVCARAQTLAELRGWSPAIALQLEYSLLERTVEGELVPMAQELGMGVMPWSPLRNGYLTGKHARGSADARAGIVPGPTDAEWEVIDVLAQVAAEAHTTMASAALAWVRARPGVASTLIGARSVAQLEANLDSLALELSDAQLEQLNQVSTPSLNFPAANNAQFGPMLAFGGMTIDGVAFPSSSIAAEPSAPHPELESSPN
jgi:aryl-alcohol dehydrogenase-like predicted oxidoreductase